jgi:hypothetical protein
MDDEDSDLPDDADGLPALFMRKRVGPRHCIWIVEHHLRRLEAQSMFPPVVAVLGDAPCPAHGILLTVATEP